LLKGKRMEPVFLVRLLRAMAMACCITARGVVGSELDVRGGSCLVCQRQLGVEDNSRGMAAIPRMTECAW
jgi:hypothetical protein